MAKAKDLKLGTGTPKEPSNRKLKKEGKLPLNIVTGPTKRMSSGPSNTQNIPKAKKVFTKDLPPDNHIPKEPIPRQRFENRPKNPNRFSDDKKLKKWFK